MSGNPRTGIRKKEEQLAAAYLRHCGYIDIHYEPDGIMPPDFVVNTSIAVELRRLNQNHGDGNDTQGLEEIAIPLWRNMRTLLTSLGPPTNDQSWFVYYRFSRPMPDWRTLRQKLEAVLKTFMADTNPQPFDLALGDGFELQVFRAGSPHNTYFVQAGHSDEQSGGWLIEEIQRNLNLCIIEKTQKIARVRHRYPEWWLVLVDFIGCGLDDFDRACLRKQVSLSHSFDKVILLDPGDHTRAFEV